VEPVYYLRMANRKSSKWKAQQSRQNLLAESPLCIFCGGSQPATTQEHCPPRHFFENRRFPQGFVFASCKTCNRGTSDFDQIFSVFAGIKMSPSSTEWRSKVDGLRRHLRHEQWKILAEEMEISSRDQHFMAMRLGKASLDEVVGNLKVIRLPKVVEKSFKIVGEKLLRGIYSNVTGSIFPLEGATAVLIHPNYDILFSESQPLQNIAQRIPGVTLPTVAQSRDLSDQFKIRYAIAEDASIINMIAFFSDSVALNLWGFANPDLVPLHGLQWLLEKAPEH
jgi:hypothetical protein